MHEWIHIVLLSTVFFMTGVIWIVQISVYPSLKWFEREGFAKRHDSYRNRIAAVVTIPMIIELIASIYLVFLPTASLGRGYSMVLLLMLVMIWISTVFIQVPQHERLSAGKDERAIASLVSGNWIRTALWTARSMMISLLLLGDSPGFL